MVHGEVVERQGILKAGVFTNGDEWRSQCSEDKLGGRRGAKTRGGKPLRREACGWGWGSGLEVRTDSSPLSGRSRLSVQSDSKNVSEYAPLLLFSLWPSRDSQPLGGVRVAEESETRP
jgi:hypothetical protein